MSTPEPMQRTAGPGEPSVLARLLPVFFALALMAMAYWAASTWVGAGEPADEAAGSDAGG